MTVFILSTVGTTIAIAGSVFCGFENAHAANCLWSFGNLALILYAIQTNQLNFAIMYSVFEFWALFGIIKHHRSTQFPEHGIKAADAV